MSKHRKDLSSRSHLRAWLAVERTEYADAKFADGTVARERLLEDIKQGGLSGDNAVGFTSFIWNYYKRAQMFTLQTPQGRQALGKVIATLMDALEAAITIHGPMPKPGVSSGTIETWGEENV